MATVTITSRAYVCQERVACRLNRSIRFLEPPFSSSEGSTIRRWLQAILDSLAKQVKYPRLFRSIQYAKSIQTVQRVIESECYFHEEAILFEARLIYLRIEDLRQV